MSRQGRHAELFTHGGRLALGCDATNTGDQFDILRAAALLAGLAKDTKVDPTWFGVMIGLNLQTSFLTPPFGFALFYLKGVCPPEVTTAQIYRGVVPFIAIQGLALVLIIVFPGIVTWLVPR